MSENAVLAISEQDERILAQIMHNIILATYQLRLYDTENPAFLQSLDTIVGFSDILAAKYGRVTLAFVNNKPAMNGIVLSPKKEEKIWEDNFIGLMKKSDITNISFLPGITLDEVKLILKGITKKKGLVELQKELAVIHSEYLKLNDPGYKQAKPVGNLPVNKPEPKPPVPEKKEPPPVLKEEPRQETPVKEEEPKAPVAAPAIKLEPPPASLEKVPAAPAPEVPEKTMPAELINNKTANDLVETFRKLSALGEKKQIKELLGGVLANFNFEDITAHKLAAATIREAFKYFRDSGNREVVRFLSLEIKTILERENDGPAYRDLASCVTDEINQEILEGDYGGAVQLLGVFILHELDGRFDAKTVLDNLLEKENVELLFRDLFSEKEAIRDFAFEILTKMKERLYLRFLRHLSSTDNLRQRRILTDVIKHMNNNAVPELIASLDDKMAIFEMIRVIEVLDTFTEQPTVYIKLETFLSHFDFKVRKESLYVLSRFGNEKALKLMTKSLYDNNPLIRQEAVRLLGNAEYKGAFAGLKAIAAPKLQFSKEEDEAVQIEAVIALGKIKHPEALKLLKGILFTHFWLKPKSDRIRGAAIQAIAMVGGEESKKLILKAKRDFSKFVRQAASGVLARKD